MTGPVARGRRMPYRELPALVRAFVDDTVGRVTHQINHPSGFSPGVAATVQTATNERYFVKAVSADVNSVTRGMHLHEAANLDLLATTPSGIAPSAATQPSAAPAIAPRLIAVLDVEPWVALITEHVPGSMPLLPWRGRDLRALTAAMDHLARTPAPAMLPTVGDEFAQAFTGWRTLAAQSAAPAHLPGDLVSCIDILASIELDWSQAAEGDSLVHGDVRSDNLLIDDGHARLVDWPYACRGHAVVDVVSAAGAVAMQGGPPPQDFLQLTGAGRQADPDAIRAIAVAAAGYFVNASRQPSPPGLPTLRTFQQAQAEQFYPWLRALL